jgi:hypothetical protein
MTFEGFKKFLTEELAANEQKAKTIEKFDEKTANFYKGKVRAYEEVMIELATVEHKVPPIDIAAFQMGEDTDADD